VLGRNGLEGYMRITGQCLAQAALQSFGLSLGSLEVEFGEACFTGRFGVLTGQLPAVLAAGAERRGARLAPSCRGVTMR
jgi:hypothetical protein